MARQYMPYIFHDPHKNPSAHPPKYLLYGLLYHTLIQERIWESYVLGGEWGSWWWRRVIRSSSARRVYFNVDNRQCKDNTIQKDPVTGPQNNITEMLCKLVKEQSAPQLDLEQFDGNPLEYTYFMSMFSESVKKNVQDPKVDWHN